MFTHLHLHTEYSLLDGAAKIKDVVKYAKELGMTALDAVLVKLEEKAHIPYTFLKAGMDVCFVAVGTLLGGIFGIGTIAAAITTGALVVQWGKIIAWMQKKLQVNIGGNETYEEV